MKAFLLKMPETISLLAKKIHNFWSIIVADWLELLMCNVTFHEKRTIKYNILWIINICVKWTSHLLCDTYLIEL